MISAFIPVNHLRISSPLLGNQRARTLMISTMGHGEEFLNRFVNYERKGVPSGAGTDTKDGFDLGRMHRLLHAFGNPQTAWPAVHVAGTKGKGSTTAMLAAILQAADYNVGTYTSPHVTTLRERIAVNGQPISEHAFNALVSQQEASLTSAQEEEGGAVSHFEAMTALAYKYFQEQQVDVAIVEAGLGGARDATNVFTSETLKLAIITAIGFEHQKALGATLREISAAKAGVLKQGRPVVVSRQPEAEALQELLKAASNQSCTVVHPTSTVHLQAQGISVMDGRIKERVLLSLQGAIGVSGDELHPQEIEMNLLGDHQLDNAAAAIAAAVLLQQDGFPNLTMQAIRRGLSAATLPGRFQVTCLSSSSDPWTPWLVLDGAHTPASAAALARTIRQAFPSQPLAFVVAMADDKDHVGFLSKLMEASPMAIVFTSVPIAGASLRSVPPGKLAAHWQALGFKRRKSQRCRELIQASLPAAVEAARREVSAAYGKGTGIICICGSLHAVSKGLEVVDASQKSSSDDEIGSSMTYIRRQLLNRATGNCDSLAGGQTADRVLRKKSS